MCVRQQQGNADMYGIGIRSGFYLQWYGIILAAWIAPSEVYNMRITTTFFTAATFLATLIGTIRRTLDPIEAYIVLLLNFGSAFFLIPLFTWRITTGFDPRWDPTRFPRAEPPSSTFNFLHLLLLIAVASFQVWFWATPQGYGGDSDCLRTGFFFERSAELSTPWFRIFNLALAATLLLILLAIALMICVTGNRKGPRDDDDWDNIEYRGRLRCFRLVDTIVRLCISSIIVFATETSIQSNHILGVNDASTSGQLIPLVIGVAAVFRVLYKAWKQVSDADTADDGFNYDAGGVRLTPLRRRSSFEPPVRRMAYIPERRTYQPSNRFDIAPATYASPGD